MYTIVGAVLQCVVMLILQPLVIKNYVYLHSVTKKNGEAFHMTVERMEKEDQLTSVLVRKLREALLEDHRTRVEQAKPGEHVQTMKELLTHHFNRVRRCFKGFQMHSPGHPKHFHLHSNPILFEWTRLVRL